MLCMSSQPCPLSHVLSASACPLSQPVHVLSATQPVHVLSASQCMSSQPCPLSHVLSATAMSSQPQPCPLSQPVHVLSAMSSQPIVRRLTRRVRCATVRLLGDTTAAVLGPEPSRPSSSGLNLSTALVMGKTRASASDCATISFALAGLARPGWAPCCMSFSLLSACQLEKRYDLC
jgi:hypothetical protein